MHVEEAADNGGAHMEIEDRINGVGGIRNDGGCNKERSPKKNIKKKKGKKGQGKKTEIDIEAQSNEVSASVSNSVGMDLVSSNACDANANDTHTQKSPSFFSTIRNQQCDLGVVRNPIEANAISSISVHEGGSLICEASVGDSGIMMGNNRFMEGFEKSVAEKMWNFAKEKLGVTGTEDDDVYIEKIKAMEVRDQSAHGRKGKNLCLNEDLLYEYEGVGRS